MENGPQHGIISTPSLYPQFQVAETRVRPSAMREVAVDVAKVRGGLRSLEEEGGLRSIQSPGPMGT